MLEVEVPGTASEHKRKIAAVNVSYSNLKTHTTDRLSSQVEVDFSNSEGLIERQTNRDVMADVVELIATERNELALKLRDEGKIKQACELLTANGVYLERNGVLYDSQKLKKYADQQIEDRNNMDKANWTRQRKIMREHQFKNKNQQGTK